jgi:hypothetical protein
MVDVVNVTLKIDSFLKSLQVLDEASNGGLRLFIAFGLAIGCIVPKLFFDLAGLFVLLVIK